MIVAEVQPGWFLPAILKKWDYFLFSKMNGQWHTSFFDAVFPFIREPAFWVPLYFFLALLAIINFKLRGLIWFCCTAGLAIVTDFISSDLIKENFLRLRPCHDPMLAGYIRFLVNYCPESSSFTSSHAVNHFAVAMFIFTTFKKEVSGPWYLLFLWAGAISYAQVYVGVHFPFDVFCGAIIGLLIGGISGKFFNAKFKLQPVHEKIKYD